MRYYFIENESDPLKCCIVKMSDGAYNYGFEYLGIQEKLVQTPLTDRCYLTMTLALSFRLGGSPFGPAGTGKTESVKALGHHLGRFVLVFNCDETFDFQVLLFCKYFYSFIKGCWSYSCWFVSSRCMGLF